MPIPGEKRVFNTMLHLVMPMIRMMYPDHIRYSIHQTVTLGNFQIRSYGPYEDKDSFVGYRLYRLLPTVYSLQVTESQMT